MPRLRRLRQLDDPSLSEDKIEQLDHEIEAIFARLGGLKRALDEERRQWPIQ